MKNPKPHNQIIPDGKIYWSLGQKTVEFLIPKTKGVGFLKCPVGQHSNRLSRFLSDLGYDCCGLDGNLSVELHTPYSDKEVPKIVSSIGKFLKRETVEVGWVSFHDYLLNNM